ncbi:hypothetical protein [Cohnella faecalis]|uniref:hypothetical protein n=1 Tax=Cohnella faecalis TaxID=2315694 RepID=UPI0013143F0D|nr:hypothetical protein [Cohnella faecalis]
MDDRRYLGSFLLFAFVLARIFAQTITTSDQKNADPDKKVQMGDLDVSFPRRRQG